MPKRVRCPHCDRLFSRDTLDAHVTKCRAQYQTNNISAARSRNRRVVVDGNNIAYHLSPKGEPRVQNLALAYHSLRNAGFEPVFVVSAALIHNINNPSLLDSFMTSAEVVKASPGTNDDLKIVQLAKRFNAEIVSNDRFLDWIDKYPWISNRLRRYRMTPSGLILLDS